jgi:hypothetical protein
MKVGDLVIGIGNTWLGDHGIGIIIGRESGTHKRLRVYWPEQGFWCYTALKGVKPL